MRWIVRRRVAWVTAVAIVAASCGGGDDAAPTSTDALDEPAVTNTTAAGGATTTTIPAGEATTTTPAPETTVAGGVPLVVEGDSNETVEAIQFLLNCNGFGDLTVDGVFGPATQAAVEAAQAGLGREVTGGPDEETVAELARECRQPRRIEGEGPTTIVGNAAPDDPDFFTIALLSNSALSIGLTPATGLTARLTGADGVEVLLRSTTPWDVETTQDYVLQVESLSEPVTYALTIEVTDVEREVGDWILATDGVIYRGTKLALGSEAQTVIDSIFDFFGHGVRDAYDEFDTGWYTITDPSDMGLRGIFIEGFAFLFFGPDPNNPDRPETFVRHRFVGPTDDADGDSWPADYATTAEGITVGDTLADLRDAYGSEVSPGSNSEEHYYRLVYSTGDLCFYFGEEAPTDESPILEIASECRS
jgi:peptidoglycan hydrolase-like protein with peptidoglycan-binding domain